MVKIPIKAFKKLSEGLEKRDTLMPAEIILDNILEARGDIAINYPHVQLSEGANIGADMLTAHARLKACQSD